MLEVTDDMRRTRGGLPKVICKPDGGKLAKCPLSNNLISLVKKVLEVHRMIASSTILLHRLNDIADSLEAAHSGLFREKNRS